MVTLVVPPNEPAVSSKRTLSPTRKSVVHRRGQGSQFFAPGSVLRLQSPLALPSPDGIRGRRLLTVRAAYVRCPKASSTEAGDAQAR